MQFLPMNNHVSQGHDKQITFHLEKCIGRHQLYFRSLFGKILAYNRLPQCSVNASSIKSFQSELTKIARLRCEKQKEDWQSTFHNEVEIWKTRQMLAWHWTWVQESQYRQEIITFCLLISSQLWVLSRGLCGWRWVPRNSCCDFFSFVRVCWSVDLCPCVPSPPVSLGFRLCQEVNDQGISLLFGYWTTQE